MFTQMVAWLEQRNVATKNNAGQTVKENYFFNLVLEIAEKKGRMINLRPFYNLSKNKLIS